MSASAQPTFAGTRCLPIEDYFHRIPLVPWICPPLHPELLRLLENIGQEAVLAPGAQIYREGEPVSRFAVVKKGLVARKLGTYGAKSDNQIWFKFQHFISSSEYSFKRRIWFYASDNHCFSTGFFKISFYLCQHSTLFHAMSANNNTDFFGFNCLNICKTSFSKHQF